MNNLTDRDFWLAYWEHKEDLIVTVPENYPMLSLLKAQIGRENVHTLLEVGGFPGYYSVWVRKNLNVQATLLDFVVHEGLLHQLEAANGLEKGTIHVLETDLFTAAADEQYDCVMSNGLIEHFTDTKAIIARHLVFLRPGGSLFISLPNFRGLNGWFQRTFDPENYARHYIQSMDLEFLRKSSAELGLKEISVCYHGGFMLWLENIREHPWWVKAFLKLVWFPLKVFSKLIPLETRAFSPYIVLTAKT